jgi:Xaa-Pro aminopeptidase
MKSFLLCRPFLFVAVFIVTPLLVVPQNCIDSGISSDEYRLRRKSLLEIVDTNSALVMKAPNAGGEYESMHFRQDQNFYYLTGVNVPGCYLLMDNKGIELGGVLKKSILFYPSFTEAFTFSDIFNGRSDTVLPADRFREIFDKTLKRLSLLYYSSPDIAFVQDWLNDKPYFIGTESRKNLKKKYPALSPNGLQDVAQLIRRLRTVKSSSEVELIRKAIAITGDGIISAAKHCKPRMWEFEIKADVEYQMTRQGAEGEAFPSIIGAGANNFILHYDKASCQTKAGDLVVMDVGAQYMGYAADVTRTIPVSGRFTKEQKEVYNIVLAAQKEIISMVRPGITFGHIEQKATELLTKAGYQKFIRHGVTHTLGLDVHDVMAGDTLHPGMVITIEPGLYIDSDAKNLPPAFRGFGIRIEDDVLVTESGYEVLSKAIPKEAEEIEKLMKEKRD